MTAAAPAVESIRPMLAAADLPRTIDFYTRKLGFTLVGAFGTPPVWCELARDGHSLMFNAPPGVARDVPRRSKDYQVFYVKVDDVAALRDELVGRGVAASPLRVTIYGMKEFEVRDPDNYWLWFGQPSNEPPTPEGERLTAQDYSPAP